VFCAALVMLEKDAREQALDVGELQRPRWALQRLNDALHIAAVDGAPQWQRRMRWLHEEE
jgi:hypothetical protein